ncbi:MAG: hypothetical protein A2289_06545 [Deltaproteobacteria bacterium RIFOXYA12_FULL_58_15]|nr:MAG: hypothetical protein A2289_06545 [Deltaproteobacteria bacterium RIFOXYA12_FULL_58_15]
MGLRPAGVCLLAAAVRCTSPGDKASALERQLWAIAEGEMPSDASGGESAPSGEPAELGEMARRVLLREDGEHPIDAINRVVFGEGGFEREVDDDGLEYVLLPSVLLKRRGACVGLGQLYLAVAKRAGLPLTGVLVPGHLFVRYNGPYGPRNIELLRLGEDMPASWYERRYPVQGEVSAYHRPLTDAEVVAVLHYNVGNAHRHARRLQPALQSYTQAALMFDDFPEAHASRGMTLQLLGELDAAEAAYRRAHVLYPWLDGLAANMDLLQRERCNIDVESGPASCPMDSLVSPSR